MEPIKEPYIEVDPAPSAWEHVVETARQEGYSAGIKMGTELAMKDMPDKKGILLVLRWVQSLL